MFWGDRAGRGSTRAASGPPESEELSRSWTRVSWRVFVHARVHCPSFVHLFIYSIICLLGGLFSKSLLSTYYVPSQCWALGAEGRRDTECVGSPGRHGLAQWEQKAVGGPGEGAQRSVGGAL